MKIELCGITNGFEVIFTDDNWNSYTMFYKTPKRATDAMHRAIDRYRRKGEF